MRVHVASCVHEHLRGMTARKQNSTYYRPFVRASVRVRACMRRGVDRQWMNVRARAQCAACLLRGRVGGKDKLATRAVACHTTRDGRVCRRLKERMDEGKERMDGVVEQGRLRLKCVIACMLTSVRE
eukprot:3785561-Pleurochrysis_carterae.AAC.1